MPKSTDVGNDAKRVVASWEMQPRDLFRRRRASGDTDPSTSKEASTPEIGEPQIPGVTDRGDADHQAPADENASSEVLSVPGTVVSIRERQMRRRDSLRREQEMSAFIGAPVTIEDDVADDDIEDDEGDEGSGFRGQLDPVTGQVWVVFRSAAWNDPEGTLRESDSLVGVYSSEATARGAVARLDRESNNEAEHWYQPYPVID